ncbi:hypothetical protein [Melissospora conviva]|uniref:hypothetical protein n=1 Tax=Melissospora conviva TaxID=3388432 RepID=UPI003C2702BE
MLHDEITDPWPFGDDADRDDPLTAHRIAATTSHPDWAYLVAFDRNSEARPTDRETAMLASYLDEWKTRWYNTSYLAHMGRRLLDVDGGANGVVFHKYGENDWGYRRRSYSMGYLFTVVPPHMRDEHSDGLPGPMSLEALMDHLRDSLAGGPAREWLDWKAAHPEVFGG